MSKQKFLALVATMTLAGSCTAMADSRWQSRPVYPSQPKVQVGVNIVLGGFGGGYGYAPMMAVPLQPMVIQPMVVQPSVVWYPGYRPVYQPVYAPAYRPVYQGEYRGHGRHDHRRHPHQKNQRRDRHDD